MRRLTALVIAILAFSVGSVRAQSPQQHVYAWAYGCDFAHAKSVVILMQNRLLFGSAGREVHVPATITTDGALAFAFDAPVGPINIFYMVDGQECTSGGGGLIVLPGHDRHVAISMYPGLFVSDWHAREFFAGTMPSYPVAVSVVASTGTDCPDDSFPESAATIDDGAYFVGYGAGLHNFLKVRAASGDTLYIRLPDPDPAAFHDQYVRRDITVADLQLLTKHGLNRGRQCVPIPSGTSERFDPK